MVKRPFIVRSVVRSIPHGGPIKLFSFQLIIHAWYNNKDRGMCYPVCGMVHIKEPLLLIGKSSPDGFVVSPSEWYLTICPTLYNVLIASLNNKKFYLTTHLK